MRYDNLPIYKSALDLCVHIERVVKGFDKYHKYTIGLDLRSFSKELLFKIHRANLSYEKEKNLEALKDRCEDFKILLHVAKELKAFKSFKSYEHTSKLSIDVCRQSQAWLNHFARVAR